MKQPVKAQLKTMHGFTLVELMVALVLGLFLMLGVTSLIAPTRSSERIGADLAQSQETARALFAIIKEDVLMAGHKGCYGSFNDHDAYESGGISVDIADNAVSITQDGDDVSLGITYADSANLMASDTNPSGAAAGAEVALAANHGLSDGTHNFVVSNCTAIKVISGTVSGNTLTLTHGIPEIFTVENSGVDRRSTQLLELVERVYSYDASTGTLTLDGDTLTTGLLDFNVTDSNGMVTLSMQMEIGDAVSANIPYTTSGWHPRNRP
jgi:prepilin-type N-terminal cleavage/methylation domain-containing protein